MVVVGAAEDEPAERSYYEQDMFGSVTASSFRLGTPLAASSAGTSEGAAHA
jgi:hypothetical protein